MSSLQAQTGTSAASPSVWEKVCRRAFARTSILLMFLVISVMLAAPLADTYPDVGAALALISGGLLLLGSIEEGNRRIVSITGLPVILVWCGARLLQAFGSETVLYTRIAHVLGLLLSGVILWALTDRMQRASEVTGHVLAEAVMIYMVFAIAFGQLYWLINISAIHAFSHVVGPTESATLLYFSLVTLTGLGDGDLTPVNPFLRLVAAFESASGLFYLAFVVAKLVASYTPGSRPSHSAHGASNHSDLPLEFQCQESKGHHESSAS
jgi:hypothetical protein